MSESSVAEHAPDLFSKVGPLPAWAWGALVVGGYMIYSHRHSSALATDAGVYDGVPSDPTGVDSSGSFPTDSAGGGAFVDPSSAGYDYGTVNNGSYAGTVSPTGQGSFSSNQAWAVYMIGFLTQQGYPPSTVTTAITHYLAGSSLTQAEADIISAALAVTPPPLPLPVNVITPTPTPVPTPTPDPTPTPTTTTTTTAATSTTKPGGFVLTYTKSGHYVTLTWTPSAHAANYDVWKDGGKVTRLSSAVHTWKSGYLATGLHHFDISAINSAGSAQSNRVAVTV